MFGSKESRLIRHFTKIFGNINSELKKIESLIGLKHGFFFKSHVYSRAELLNCDSMRKIDAYLIELQDKIQRQIDNNSLSLTVFLKYQELESNSRSNINATIAKIKSRTPTKYEDIYDGILFFLEGLLSRFSILSSLLGRLNPGKLLPPPKK